MLRITVTGAASSQLLLRVLNLIAQRSAVPHSVSAACRDGTMRIVVDIAEQPALAVEALTTKLHALVEAVEVGVVRIADAATDDRAG